MTSPIDNMPAAVFNYMSKYLKDTELANLSAVSKVAQTSLNAAWKAIAKEQLHIEKLQHPENARKDVEEYYHKRNEGFLFAVEHFKHENPFYAKGFSALSDLPKNPLGRAKAIETFI